ncbi:MAG: GrdX family protein [Mogibacterium sp.]|nr:GrdX family protein [Mogibacterium sp.]
MKYRILTNNPMVAEEFNLTHEVAYSDISAKEILGRASEGISNGEILLNHPLYGSLKPNETPYRSLLLRKKEDISFTAITNEESAALIVKALGAYEKFTDKKETTDTKLLKDYQVVDLSLTASAVAAADR